MSDMKTKFKIITEKEKCPGAERSHTVKYAVTEDGVYHCIYGGKYEYFRIDNPYHTLPESNPDELFSNESYAFLDHATDAIQAIIDGYAHSVINIPDPLNIMKSPEPTRPWDIEVRKCTCCQTCAIYFLDEEFGEKERQHIIDVAGGMELGYHIRFGKITSDGYYHYVNTRSECDPSAKDPIFFRTYDEAKAFVSNVVDTAKSAAKAIHDKTAQPSEFDNYYGNIIYAMIYDIVHPDYEFAYRNGGDLARCKISIVQGWMPKK